MMNNPVVYFEIPVLDLHRAVTFYAKVFGFEFEYEVVDGYDMAFFPFAEKNAGITGALVKGDVYHPTKDGTILYFRTDNIDVTLQKALDSGGNVLYPKTINQGFGNVVAEFEDTEGNRIALLQNLA